MEPTQRQIDRANGVDDPVKWLARYIAEYEECTRIMGNYRVTGEPVYRAVQRLMDEVSNV